MAGQIHHGIIGVHERAVDHGHTLQDVLQTLAEIVRIAEAHVLIEHDVDLDVQLVACVVRLQSLDVPDRLGEAHGQVEQDVALVGGRRSAAQVPDVFRTGFAPVEYDVQRQEKAAQGVQPPDASVVADEREDDGECVEDDVCRGVLGERLDGGIAHETAPEPAEALDCDGAEHDGNGGDAEFDDAVVWREEPVEAL